MIGDKIRNVLDAWREAIISGDAIPYEVFEAGCVELRDAARMADAVEDAAEPGGRTMIGDKIRNVLDAWREAIISGDAIIPYEVFEGGCVELRDAARMADAVEDAAEPGGRTMIGDKIRNVFEAWGEAIISGDAIPYEVIAARLILELRDAARMADAVERRRVPTHLRVVGSDDATAPVVDLLAFRKRIPARPKYLPHGGPKGGSAA